MNGGAPLSTKSGHSTSNSGPVGCWSVPSTNLRGLDKQGTHSLAKACTHHRQSSPAPKGGPHLASVCHIEMHPPEVAAHGLLPPALHCCARLVHKRVCARAQDGELAHHALACSRQLEQEEVDNRANTMWRACADHTLACRQQRGRRQSKQGIGEVQAYIRTQRREECRHTAASLWREIAGRRQHTHMRATQSAHPASVKSSSTSKEEGGWARVTRARTHLALRPPARPCCP